MPTPLSRPTIKQVLASYPAPPFSFVFPHFLTVSRYGKWTVKKMAKLISIPGRRPDDTRTCRTQEIVSACLPCVLFSYRPTYSLIKRDSSVSIVTTPRAERHPCNGRVFLCVTASVCLETHPATFSFHTGGDATMREADHSHPSIAEVTNVWSYTSKPLVFVTWYRYLYGRPTKCFFLCCLVQAL